MPDTAFSPWLTTEVEETTGPGSVLAFGYSSVQGMPDFICGSGVATGRSFGVRGMPDFFCASGVETGLVSDAATASKATRLSL